MLPICIDRVAQGVDVVQFHFIFALAIRSQLLLDARKRRRRKGVSEGRAVFKWIKLGATQNGLQSELVNFGKNLPLSGRIMCICIYI